MKFFYLLSFFLFLGGHGKALAGDGGYTLASCVSNSGRSLLSILLDWYSDAENTIVTRLIIDGQMLEYKSGNLYGAVSSKKTKTDTIERTKDKLVVTNGKEILMSVKIDLSSKNGKTSATLQPNFKDPRQNTGFKSFISKGKPIKLNCRKYYKAP
jgi:hypothetical protein